MPTTKVIRLKRWKIDVLANNPERGNVIYTVIAVDEMDARIIAFCLGGGFPHTTRVMTQEHITTIKADTRILEISNA